MALQEHIRILKQGVEVWNKWRANNPIKRPDLSGVDLRGADLRGANLSGADLNTAGLSGADLREADLSWADLSDADLSRAVLSGAAFYEADLSEADLRGAELNGAVLIRADLHRAKLRGSDFNKTYFSGTSITDVDLSEVKGLHSVVHDGPSSIGIDTIYRSRGRIPEMFLRGVGVPDSLIEYIQSLTREPIQYYSCFISYSSKDQAFVEELYSDLQNKGIRCWFAPEDMKIGDPIRDRIDREIRVHDRLLLVLSENSIDSSWVEKEVETAFEEETRRKKDDRKSHLVLFPIRLDQTVMDTNKAWAADIRRTRHIGDFRRWKDHDSYKKAVDRLMRDLKAEN